jgi:Flp pilus assembly protein TadG
MSLPIFPNLWRRVASSEFWGGFGPLRRSSVSQNRLGPKVKLEKGCRVCRRNRQGAAAVEFALVAPVFFLMVFAIFEFGRAIMVQQVLTNAAREGARVAILDSPTPTHDLVVSTVNTYLQSAGLPSASASVAIDAGSSHATEPTDASVKYGAPVKVTVQIPYNSVSWLPISRFFPNKNLTASTMMRRETVQ